jgi:hypothetical protein
MVADIAPLTRRVLVNAGHPGISAPSMVAGTGVMRRLAVA